MPTEVLSDSDRRILSACRTLSKQVIDAPDFKTTLQSVKGALYDKDYERAFSQDSNLQAYFARWVPSRALIFQRIFAEFLIPRLDNSLPCRMIGVGAGAGSEILAYASCLADLADRKDDSIFSIDRSDWACVLDPLGELLLSGKLPEWNGVKLNIVHRQLDCLNSDGFQNAMETQTSQRIFTMLFVVTELLLQSRARTVALLANITACTQPKDVLLFVESANLATIKIGATEYQLGLLLDHILLKSGQTPQWKLAHSQDSIYYRLPAGIDRHYPLKLENARVLIRVYERL